MIVSAAIPALGEAVLAGGYAGSRILATRGDRIVTQDYSPSGVAKYMVKDVAFATADSGTTTYQWPGGASRGGDLWGSREVLKR